MSVFDKKPTGPAVAARPGQQRPAPTTQQGGGYGARPQQPTPRQAPPPPAPPTRQQAFNGRQQQAAPQQRQVAQRGAPQQRQQAVSPDDDMFDGMSKQDVQGDFNYIGLGNYLLRVDTCKIGKNRKKEKFFASVMTVIHVFEGPDLAEHKVGDSVSFFQKQSSDYFLKEVKGLVTACLPDVDQQILAEIAKKGLPASDENIDAEWRTLLFEAVSDKQPFSGFVIESKGKQQPIKDAPGKFWKKVRYRYFGAENLGTVQGLSPRFGGLAVQQEDDLPPPPDDDELPPPEDGDGSAEPPPLEDDADFFDN